MPAGAEANRRLATCSVNTFALNRLPFAIQSPMVLVLDRKSLDEGQIIGLLQEGDVLGASLLEFPWVMLPEGSFVRHPKMRQGRIKLLRSGWLISQHPQYGELMHALSMDQVRKLFSEEAFAKLPLVKEAAQAAKATSNRPVQLEDDLPATDSYPGAKSSPPKSAAQPSGATPTAAPKAALPAASPVTVVTPPLPPAATATSSKTRPKETSKAAQAAPASASTASAPASTVSTVQGAAARQGRSEAALVSGVPRRPWAPVAAPSPASPATPATETSPSVAKAEATPKSPVSVPKAAPKSPSASVTPKASSNGGVSSTLAKMPKQTRAAPELCQRHLQMCNCEHWKVIHTFVFVRSDASLDSEPLAVLREGSLLCAAKPEEPRSSDGKWARLGSQAKVWSEITSDRPDFVALGREEHSRRRSADVYESLYAQGLELRARQAEQAELAKDPGASHQVLGRSREYYWQMLDRQIRDAFDKAAQGNQLAYTEMEDFLRYFGVMARADTGNGKVSTPLAAERLKESRKLRTALWRHLDPQQVGYVDFLTLQVFFWVLMVAVHDESLEAQKLHNLAQKACEESTDAVSGSQATSAVDMAKLAASQVAPDGSKICELLMRFNPKQLRQEFKQLYLDRLHHGKWTEGPEAEPSTSSVSLSSKSRRLAERAHLRIQEESGSRRHVDMLLWRQEQVEAHRQRLREERDAQQVEQCTFRPCLVSRHNRSMNGGLRLYTQATARQACREENAAVQEQHRLDKEMSGCTFRPNLRKSDKSFHATSKTFRPSPRGADACAQRMRKAFAEKDSRRRFLEERAPSDRPSQISAGCLTGTYCEEPRALASPGRAKGGSMGDPELRARSTWVTATPTPSQAGPAASPEGEGGVKAEEDTAASGANGASKDLASPAVRQRRVQPKQRPTQRPQAVPRCGTSPKETARRPQIISTPPSARAGPRLPLPTHPRTDTMEAVTSPRPLLIAEVNISQELPPQKIFLYASDDVSQVARRFAERHHLAPHLAERLKKYLTALSQQNERAS